MPSDPNPKIVQTFRADIRIPSAVATFGKSKEIEHVTQYKRLGWLDSVTCLIFLILPKVRRSNSKVIAPGAFTLVLGGRSNLRRVLARLYNACLTCALIIVIAVGALYITHTARYVVKYITKSGIGT